MSESEKMDVDLSIVKDEPNEMTYEEKLRFVSVIAKPMAPKKLAKKITKCIKKGKVVLHSVFNKILFFLYKIYYYICVMHI